MPLKMFKTFSCVIFASFLCFQISVGQIASFNNGYPESFSESGASSFLQDFSSSAPLKKESNFQIAEEPITSFSEASLPLTNSSLGSNSTVSPIEIFISEFHSAIYTSNILPDIFDLKEHSPEAFSKSMFDYVYAYAAAASYNNPQYLASMIGNAMKEGIESYTLPVMVDIYSNYLAKYLFDKGVLNSTNASYLAQKYIKTIEKHAELSWKKETPESKFLVLQNGFVEYMKSIDLLRLSDFDDIIVYFVKELKRVSAKS